MMPSLAFSATAKVPLYNALIVPYNASALAYLGRWQDTGKGKWSGWGGTQLAFKVSGTRSFHIEVEVNDADVANAVYLRVGIDNSPQMPIGWTLSSELVKYNGTRLVVVALPDLLEHTIIIHTAGNYAGMFAGTSKVLIKQILVPQGGVLTAWTQGSKYIQTVGDSWMGSDCDWPRLMDRTKWKLFPIATGGFTAALMDTQYNYKSSGVSATDDPTMDAVIVSLGVNDYAQGVSVPNFQTSLLALVDKIRAKQASAPIFLIQAPKNLGTGMDFGQYETAMQNVVAARANTAYISTRSLEASLTWEDNYHLDAAGKIILADYVNAALIAAGL